VAGGLLIGLLATLCVPATYWLLRSLQIEREPAFAAASYLALTPSLVMLLPQFDQLYPILACTLIVTWIAAIQHGGTWRAIGFGIMLAVTTFFAFNLLAIGVFLLGYVLLDAQQRHSLRPLIRQSFIAIATFSLIYLFLWTLAGYRPIETFIVALHEQHRMQVTCNRDCWPLHLPTDLADFALGIGYIALPLILFSCLRRRLPHVRLLALIAAQVAIVWLTGLMRCETARLWLFMFPLILLPVGIELATWQRQHRLVVYACLWFIVLMLTQNLRLQEAFVVN
jgi:hypothetical protein